MIKSQIVITIGFDEQEVAEGFDKEALTMFRHMFSDSKGATTIELKEVPAKRDGSLVDVEPAD